MSLYDAIVNVLAPKKEQPLFKALQPSKYDQYYRGLMGTDQVQQQLEQERQAPVVIPKVHVYGNSNV